MKIGILTFYSSEDNYGQQLQLFALQQYLKNKGHIPFLIRYDRWDTSTRARIFDAFHFISIKGLAWCLIKKAKELLRKTNENLPKEKRGFSDFREKHINMSDQQYCSLRELRKKPPEADMYIVGSDQVWNFYDSPIKDIRHYIHIFFLDFGPNSVKRVAYAASWGRESIPKEQMSEIQPLIKRFQSISVREESGIKICEKCGYDKAKWSCDPTLLFDANYYRDLYLMEGVEANGKRKKPYVLFYYADNSGEFDKRKVYEWANKHDLEVVYITGNTRADDNWERTNATITDWIYLIDNAEYIITNSFHCCVFSLLFEKKFAAILLNGKNESMNTRVSSLFELCNVTPRYLTETDFSALEIPVEKINISEKYLASNLNFELI